MFAPASWTVPSHAALFSGLLPRSAGFGAPAATHADFKVAASRLRHRWLPAVLSDAGYATAGVTTNLWVSQSSGFDLGFADFSHITAERSLQMSSSSLRGRASWALQALRARVDDGAAAVERLIESWLLNGAKANRPRAPFFWFVNLVECHSPYLPPKPYNELSMFDRLRASEEARRHLTFAAFCKGSSGGFDVPPDALARMRKLYSASIRLMDDWLARIVAGLEQHGLLDDTIVAVTSDHGENLGEGEMMGHALSLDDRLIRVPFVVTGPASPLPAPRASLIDVPAWLAGSAGLTDHPFTEGDGDRQVAVAQFDAASQPDNQIARSVEVAPHKVGPDDEARWADELKLLRAALDEAEGTEVPGVTSAGPAPSPSDEIADLEARMKLLGYL
jgi:arylsulfatase A-like enzyme